MTEDQHANVVFLPASDAVNRPCVCRYNDKAPAPLLLCGRVRKMMNCKCVSRSESRRIPSERVLVWRTLDRAEFILWAPVNGLRKGKAERQEESLICRYTDGNESGRTGGQCWWSQLGSLASYIWRESSCEYCKKLAQPQSKSKLNKCFLAGQLPIHLFMTSPQFIRWQRSTLRFQQLRILPRLIFRHPLCCLGSHSLLFCPILVGPCGPLLATHTWVLVRWVRCCTHWWFCRCTRQMSSRK